jgi:hypothetical protein
MPRDRADPPAGRPPGRRGDEDDPRLGAWVIREPVWPLGNQGLVGVAEGVEQRAELAQLRTLGCEHAQGFLPARPLAGAGAHELLGARDAVRTSYGSSLNVIGNSTN